MVHQGIWNQKFLTISAKLNCLTISVESREVFSFDRHGRLWTALVDDISYRRGLDGKIVAKWQTPNRGRGRRWLTSVEAEQLIARGQTLVSQIHGGIEKGEISLSPPPDKQGIEDIQAAICFDPAAAERDAQEYARIYKPVGILPPDQYLSVVLQAAEGCSFNTCTFCDFYRDRPFRIKNPQQFSSHVRAVKQYLGKGLSLRRTVFLGDANALVIPMPRLLELLDIVHNELDVERLGGIYAFLDGFSGERKATQDYARLASLGLKRVYIGMESGHAPLLSYLHKPGSPEDVIQAVRNMKSGGVAVGIIILLGAGGKKYAASHVHDTINAINAMPLDMDDLIYFSELVENENLPYVKDAYQNALLPLNDQERSAQSEAIESGLIFSSQGGTPHISRYDIREFVY